MHIAEQKINVLTTVLCSRDQPALSNFQRQRVLKAHHAHREYMRYAERLDDSDDDSGPKDDDAWLYEDLIILTKLYSRLKDREQLIALIFEVRGGGQRDMEAWLNGLSVFPFIFRVLPPIY